MSTPPLCGVEQYGVVDAARRTLNINMHQVQAIVDCDRVGTWRVDS